MSDPTTTARRRARLTLAATSATAEEPLGPSALLQSLRGSLAVAERAADAASDMRDQMNANFDFIGAAKAQRVVTAARRAVAETRAALDSLATIAVEEKR